MIWKIKRAIKKHFRKKANSCRRDASFFWRHYCEGTTGYKRGDFFSSLAELVQDDPNAKHFQILRHEFIAELVERASA